MSHVSWIRFPLWLGRLNGLPKISVVWDEGQLGLPGLRNEQAFTRG